MPAKSRTFDEAAVYQTVNSLMRCFMQIGEHLDLSGSLDGFAVPMYGLAVEAPALRRCRRTPKAKSQHRHPDVDRSARSRRPDCRKQFFLHDPEVDDLIPRNVGDDDTDLKLGKVLLKFDAPIDCYENVKLFLRRRQEISVFQRVPALLVNGRRSEFANEQLDARIYALVNEDAHSRSWLLAKSSTARTCPRLIEG